MKKTLILLIVGFAIQFNVQPGLAQFAFPQNKTSQSYPPSIGIGSEGVQLYGKKHEVFTTPGSDSDLKGNSRKIYLSYLGEMITHPGLRMGYEEGLYGWEDRKSTNRNRLKSIYREIGISASAGIFYHRRYQTGILFLPEFYYSRKTVKSTLTRASGIKPGQQLWTHNTKEQLTENRMMQTAYNVASREEKANAGNQGSGRIIGKGPQVMFGLGVGYLYTIVPNTWELETEGKVRQVYTSRGYLLSEGFVSFEWDRIMRHSLPFRIFLKPQIHYAIPHFPNGLLYFMLEAGCKYELPVRP